MKARLDAAETDWRSKIEGAARSRADLLRTVRPDYVASFKDLIRESDALLNLHLQRYGKLRHHALDRSTYPM